MVTKFLMSQLILKDIFTMHFVNCVQKCPFTIEYVPFFQWPRNNIVQLYNHQPHVTDKARRSLRWKKHGFHSEEVYNLKEETETNNMRHGVSKEL